MPSVIVKTDAARVAVSLRAFALSLQQRQKLMEIVGLGQLKSIYLTFAEGGSPAGSWPGLSAASLSWRRYSAGHKLLMDTGRLRNSIKYSVEGNVVTLGTGVRYAAVHQYGFDGSQSVRPYSYTRRAKSRDQFARQTINKAGRTQTVRRKVSSGISTVSVKAFSRHLHIPARPFLVFRPEDPARIQGEVETWIAAQAKASGLEAK